MTRSFFLVIGLGASLSALGCSGSTGSPLTQPCAPASSQACACPGGGQGLEVCSSTGDFLPCICATLDAGVQQDALAKGDSNVPHGDAACTCDSPPAPTCRGGSTLLVSYLPATCAGGRCAYTEQQVTCSDGCSNGACSGPNACAGVTCDDPPFPACLSDGVTLQTSSDQGTCVASSCTYGVIDSVCQFGCDDGACDSDPCEDVSCGAPPPAECVSATGLQTYESQGTCSNGMCNYASAKTTCTTSVAHATAACRDGACTFTCQNGYGLSGGQCVGSGTSTPPADLTGTWTLESHSCQGETIPLSGWNSTFSVAAGSVQWDSQFQDGCTLATNYAGVTYTATTIVYTSGSTVCGSACSQENGDVCTAGPFAGGSMSYTLASAKLMVTLSAPDYCDSGLDTLTTMQE